MLNNEDVDFEDLSVKIIYEKLIENQNQTPVIERHFPNREYEHIYRKSLILNLFQLHDHIKNPNI